MSLTAPPPGGNLGEHYPSPTPFGVTAAWEVDGGWRIAVRPVGPGGDPWEVEATFAAREYAIAGYLAEQIATVDVTELPIVLRLVEPTETEGWRFEYLGKPAVRLAPSDSGRGWEPINGDQPAVSPAELDPPYVFDPAPHMDPDTAPASPTPVPEPAPPGPEPRVPSTLPPTPVPEPGRPLGSYGDQSVPFGR